MPKISLTKEINEIKNQLAYAKNIGFFFGAGTSCALSIPNIEMLTKAVEDDLSVDLKKSFLLIKDDLALTIKDKQVNIEDILNQIRRIREITGESDKDYIKVTGKAAKELDKEICTKIYNKIFEKEKTADLQNPKRFFAWLNILNREFSKEVFTTNYDLIIEKSLEESRIPYFDGFVGSYEPFFWPDSIDTFIGKEDLTKNWIRLWKIHGSLSWFWKLDSKTNSQNIIRIGKIEDIKKMENELVIYPSKEKYDASRKQPFLAYFDRLKNYLLNGELLFVFTGYSFSDQHINEIVFNCLRQNSRLFAMVYFFKDEEVVKLHSQIATYMNLNVFGPKKAIITGSLGEWEFPELDEFKKDKKQFEHYWNETDSTFTLGDFNKLVDFLIINSGKKEAIDASIK
ncbi:MAG: SIR2 family protein [Bacteroidota bacterium]